MRDGEIADPTGRPLEIEPLIARFAECSARIGVIGLGYVGLPLVRCLAEQGFAVLGFDIDPDKVERLNRGGSCIRHIAAESIAALRRSGRFAATADFSRLGEPDANILCVPTRLVAADGGRARLDGHRDHLHGSRCGRVPAAGRARPHHYRHRNICARRRLASDCILKA